MMFSSLNLFEKIIDIGDLQYIWLFYNPLKNSNDSFIKDRIKNALSLKMQEYNFLLIIKNRAD